MTHSSWHLTVLSLDGMLFHYKLLYHFPIMCLVSPTICQYLFILLSGEKYSECKATYARTTHNGASQGLTPDQLIQSLVH